MRGAAHVRGRRGGVRGRGPGRLLLRGRVRLGRTYKLLADGRRQIDAFHLPGDIFGVEAGGDHRFSAEAVTDTKLVVHRRERSALAGNDGDLARKVVAAMMRSLERAQDHMMLLGRKSAKERIATFLLGLAERLAEQGGARPANAPSRHGRPPRADGGKRLTRGNPT